MIPPIPMLPPTYAQTTEAIGKCSIPIANIRIDYEDGFQSDLVTITDVGEVTEDKFRCLRNAVHPFYILMIENTDQRAAFYEFERREDRPHQKARAVEWLRQQGLLDRVPRFDPREGVERFAISLEEACGLAPESALMALDSSTVTFQPSFVRQIDPLNPRSTFGCLMQMFIASDAEENNARLVFVGNEALSDGYP